MVPRVVSNNENEEALVIKHRDITSLIRTKYNGDPGNNDKALGRFMYLCQNVTL